MHSPRFTPRHAWLCLALAAPAFLQGQISLQITIGPPPIPVYEQPILPEEGYAWIPGYWAWGEDGYFWVPGTWARVPEWGLLWTPGYWGWRAGAFEFHSGYWGTHVGYYGGINYGYGYGGTGFDGGYWQGQNYYYNRSVTNINLTRVTYVYNRTVVVHNPSYVAYNGGAGGVNAVPSAQELTLAREHRVRPTMEQSKHYQNASQNRELLASVNRGRPAVAATGRPGDFSRGQVVPAKAPGGHVEDAVLRATPKTMAAPPAGRPAAAPEAPPARPGRPSREEQPQRPSRDREAPPEPRGAERSPAQRPVPEPRPQREPEPSRAPRPEPRPRPDVDPHRAPAPLAPGEPPHPNAEPERRPGKQPGQQPKPKQPKEKPGHEK